MAAATQLPRVREEPSRARRTETNRTVASTFSGVLPFNRGDDGLKLPRSVHGESQSDAASKREDRDPSVPRVDPGK